MGSCMLPRVRHDAGGWAHRIVPVGVLGALVIPLAVPLPLGLLDALLALNLALSLGLLAAAVEGLSPRARAALPSLLLGSALFRLALEVAASRAILGRGDGGAVIAAFGRVATRGDWVSGAVSFALLAAVQYLVVARGGERAAEVAARFALDALPGQQLALDAELRAGAVDPAEARERRGALAAEARFHGAMDGALRFVKGESLAGVVIVAVNLLAGVAVGVWSHGLDLSGALARYGTLAVGQGLASQLPSLFVAAAAAFAVTRGPGVAVTGDGLRAGLGEHRRAVVTAAGVLGVLAVLPGLPGAPLGLGAALLGAVGLVGGTPVRARARPRAVLGLPPAEAARFEATLGARGVPLPEPLEYDPAGSPGRFELDGTCLGEGHDGADLAEAVVRSHAGRLWDLPAASAALQALTRAVPALGQAARAASVDAAVVAGVLGALAEEGVPTGNVRVVVDALCRSPASDLAGRVGAVRKALGPELVALVAGKTPLGVYALSPEAAEALRAGPRVGEGVAADLREGAAAALAEGPGDAVILADADVRRRVWEVLSPRFVVRVVSPDELPPQVTVKVLGWIGPAPDEA